MMRLIFGFVLLGGILLFRILPVMVTVAVSCGTIDPRGMIKGDRRIFGILTVLSGGLHAMLYMVLHRLLIHRWNFVTTAKNIVKFRFSYQDTGYFIRSLLICMAAAFLFGFVLRRAASRFGADIIVGGRAEQKENAFVFLAVSLAGIGCAAAFAAGASGMDRLVINEVCGNNQIFLSEESGDTPDYVELYNGGMLSFEIKELYLSDDETVLKKEAVPVCEIPAGGRLVVWLDDGGFSLGGDGGETVFLSDGAGNILDRVAVERADMDFSYARQKDGESVWAVLSGTPGAPNQEGTEWVKSPVLSYESGFYPEAFDLAVFSEPGTDIYYTVDGSVPTAESQRYQGPIHIYDRTLEESRYRTVRNVSSDWMEREPPDPGIVDKAFVLRAVAVDRQGQVSEPVTATYFVNMEGFRETAAVSLVADPEDLFGDDGIYVTGAEYDAWYLGGQAGEAPQPNFQKRGSDAEIPAYFEYFSDDLKFSQNLGLRVSGASSREDPLKHFSVYARKQYGGGRVLDGTIFEGVTSRKLMIRDGMANAVCQDLVRDRNVATQRYVRAAVFLNGEFWYYADLLEKYDAHYFQQRYDIAEDNIVVVNQGISEGIAGDEALRQEVYDFLETHDMADADSYEKFGRLVDLQSYIDFMCINIYADNMDFSETLNVVTWRAREPESDNPYGDGRWRWALYDMDAMGWNDGVIWDFDTQQEKNTFCLTPRFVSEEPINRQVMYRSLKENPDFCRQFVLTFMDLVNTDFQYEQVKFRLDAYTTKESKDHYESFFKERASYIVPYMAEEFGLTGTLETVTLAVDDPEAGTITLNTATPELTGGTWSGQYYTDYPVTVTAKAADGYVFAGWEKSSLSGNSRDGFYEENTVEIPVEEGGIKLHAVFEKVE